jgi:hypothetical protein
MPSAASSLICRSDKPLQLQRYMTPIAIGLHLHLGAPRRRVNAIENHFHQQMVIWRSLSPSILARVLEFAAARLRRKSAAPQRHRAGVQLRLVGEAPSPAEPDGAARSQPAPGE